MAVASGAGSHIPTLNPSTEYECSLCLDDFTGDKLITCGEHNFCYSCLKDVIVEGEQNMTLYKSFDIDKFGCSCSQCSKHIYEDQIIMSGDPDLIKSYMNMSITFRTKKSLDENIEIEKQDIDQSIERLKEKVLEEIPDVITNALKCPHCQSVFYDFTGCLGLTCSTCGKMFCGICLNSDYEDSHDCVRIHTADPVFCQKYECHGTFFITESGWNKYRKVLQTDSLMKYLKKLDQRLVFKSIKMICQYLYKNKILDGDTIQLLENSVFTTDVKFVKNFHLINLPLIVTSLYATKHDMKFNTAYHSFNMTQKDKIDLGCYVIGIVKKEFPDFVAKKIKVSGENYGAICYPIQTLETVTKAVIEFGRKRDYWK